MSEKTRTPLIPFLLLRSILSRMMLALLIIVLTNGGYLALAHNPPVDVSGYETFLGIDCTLAGQPATCGVTFAGWIGSDGPVVGGWEPFPGDFQGLWNSRVNYLGKAGFRSTVLILGGRYQISFLMVILFLDRSLTEPFSGRWTNLLTLAVAPVSRYWISG
jgi:hypothetical protein